MLFNITGKHIEITDAIRTHSQEKTANFPKYYSSINQVEVVIDGSEGKGSSVEIIARAEHNRIFIAKETGEDMYACIDVAAHKIERQLSEYKKKERNNKHTPMPK